MEELFSISFRFNNRPHTADVIPAINKEHGLHFKVILDNGNELFVRRDSEMQWMVCCGRSEEIDYGIAPVIGKEIERHVEL